MSDLKQDERGFSPIETILVVVIVAVIGFVGWYIYHAKQNTDKSLDAANTTSNNAGPRFTQKTTSTTSGDDSNASLQTDLQSISSSNTQSNKDLAASNNSLNDKSTLTTVPQ